MTVSGYPGALAKAWTTLLSLTLVGAAIGAIVTLATAKQYVATAEVAATTSSRTAKGESPTATAALARNMDSYASIASASSVTGPVIRDLRLHLTEPELAGKIRVTTSPSRGVLALHVTDGDAQQAARFANEIAARLDDVVDHSARPTAGGVAPARLVVIQSATVPGSPITPRPVVDIGVGAILGLLVGMSLVAVQFGVGRSVGGTDQRSTRRTLVAEFAPAAGGGADAVAMAARSPRVGRHQAKRPAHDRVDKRLDIQGLRAVAVALVVLFHAGWSALPGGFIGVDVFFVISGFLITGNINRMLAVRDFSLFGFYANRARRLLPAAFVTIATTCFVSYLVLPPDRFASIGRDAVASACYVVNWRLAGQSVDYLAQGQAPSPFQHFWSLAVEEQYYLLWPLLLAAGYALARGVSRRRSALLLAIIVVLLPSFVYSMIYTSSNPSQAYFVTTTRMWELAVGGVIALTAEFWRRLPVAVAALIGWFGLSGIVYTAIVYTGATYFPGYAATLPVLSAAAVILAGPAAGGYGPVACLGRAVMVFLGNISYSLYLWHWPIIVFVTAQFTGALPLWAGLLAAIGSLVPAYLSYRFIEGPGMRSASFASTGGGLRLGLLATTASVVAALLLLVSIPQLNLSNVSVAATGVATNVQGHTVKVGAEVLRPHPLGDPAGAPKDSFRSITPSPLTASTEDVPADGKCSRPELSATDVPCVFGAAHSRIQVDLVGDSHAMQWEPALAAAGLTHNWRVVTHTKAACPFSAAAFLFQGRPDTSCIQWNKAVIKSIIAEHPQLVITSELGGKYPIYKNGHDLSGEANVRQVIKGYTAAWHALVSAGIHVAALAETPRPLVNIPSCVTENLHQLSTCAGARSEMIDKASGQRLAAEQMPKVHYIDMNDVICPTSQCAAVIAGVMVYRDSDHLSATYARTTAGFFANRFAPYIAD